MSHCILHVHRVTHLEFKRVCRERRVRMKEQIDRLIWDWLRSAQGPPVKKRLEPLGQTHRGLETQRGQEDPFEAAPFWDKGIGGPDHE